MRVSEITLTALIVARPRISEEGHILQETNKIKIHKCAFLNSYTQL